MSSNILTKVPAMPLYLSSTHSPTIIMAKDPKYPLVNPRPLTNIIAHMSLVNMYPLMQQTIRGKAETRRTPNIQIFSLVRIPR